MVRLFNNKSFFKENEILYDPEMFFINRVSAKDLSSDSLKIIADIDKAKLISISTGKIETPFGICSIEDLSTGCKVAICIVYINEHKEQFGRIKAIYATEAGVNALNSIFEYIEKTMFNIAVIAEQEDVFECSNRLYSINDEYTVDSLLTMHRVGD